MIERFHIDVPAAVIDRILRRVTDYDWSNVPDAGGWSAGAGIAEMRRLGSYWVEQFQWRAAEAQLNRFPHFMTTCSGQRLHFVHVRGSAPRALLLTHGWPGSFFEFLELIEPLAFPGRFGGDASQGFDVIVPSLPGYGFSGPPLRPIGPRAIAKLFHELVTGPLGYTSFIAQGGDIGSMVSAWIAHDYPEACRGLHLNMVVTHAMGAAPETDEERAYFANFRAIRERESGYSHLQSTRPQTLAYAMADNPVGVAAWILEKFAAWSDIPRPGGIPDLAAAYSEDQLLTNIMIYLVTESFATSTWLYKGRLDEDSALLPAPVKVPAAIAAFPDPVFAMPPRSLVEKSYSVARYTSMAHGGHFAALEAPEALIGDIRAFAAQLRN
jgi:pimeloyl-ACP methyl ester carboxylesterase